MGQSSIRIQLKEYNQLGWGVQGLKNSFRAWKKIQQQDTEHMSRERCREAHGASWTHAWWSSRRFARTALSSSWKQRLQVELNQVLENGVMEPDLIKQGRRGTLYLSIFKWHTSVHCFPRCLRKYWTWNVFMCQWQNSMGCSECMCSVQP